jgi:hypothetical protein
MSMCSYCSATLTEGFPCFFLSCRANTRVWLAKTGHGPHCSCCVVLCIAWLVSFYVLFVCKCVLYCTVLYCTVLLPPGGDPIAVNNISYIKIWYCRVLLNILTWRWYSTLTYILHEDPRVFLLPSGVWLAKYVQDWNMFGKEVVGESETRCTVRSLQFLER